mgnify:CR=1 FL=1
MNCKGRACKDCILKDVCAAIDDLVQKVEEDRTPRPDDELETAVADIMIQMLPAIINKDYRNWNKRTVGQALELMCFLVDDLYVSWQDKRHTIAKLQVQLEAQEALNAI